MNPLDRMSLTELKALAYDFIAQKEIAEQNLRAVNGEIARKTQAAASLPAPVKERLENGQPAVT